MTGGVLMAVGLMFGFAETVYFGGNWVAQSRAEVICDFIACSVSGLGALLFIAGR